MPIYDFECSACGFKDEVMRKSSAANTDVCPQCAQQTFNKQLSAPSFQLNGSGWYATDFKDNKEKKPKAATEKITADDVKTITEKPAAACATGCACH
jgi:putative FmdB family regulatory protein